MVDLTNKFSKLVLRKELENINDEELQMTREEEYHRKKDVLNNVTVYISVLMSVFFGFFIGAVFSRKIIFILFFKNMSDISFIFVVGSISFVGVFLIYWWYYKNIKPKYDVLKNKYKDLYEKFEPNDIYKYKRNLKIKKYISELKNDCLFITLSIFGTFMGFYIILIVKDIRSFLFPIITIGYFYYAYRDGLKKINKREEVIEKIKKDDTNNQKE